MSEITFKVADGIMDKAVEEFRDTNLKDAESVQQYADGGLNIWIGIAEAEFILGVCKKILEMRAEGADINWYNDFEEPLMEYDWAPEVPS